MRFYRPKIRLVRTILLIAILVLIFVTDLVVPGSEQKRIIAELRNDIRDGYVDPALAQEMDSALAAREERTGRFSIAVGPFFAFGLSDDLRTIAHDAHLRVFYSLFPIPEDDSAESDKTEMERERQQEAASNFGFDRVEVMQGDVGYIEIDHLAPPELASDALADAMNRIAGSKALILDFRHNHGGSPYMGLLLASYFFDQPVHWVDLKGRNRVKELWTDANVKGKKYLNKPVYILTSQHTFSGGEGFSYHMKNLKRATIVGERTGGGANPGAIQRLNSHFSLFLPTQRAISPVTGTNWESVGVQPDVEVPADEALTKALELCRDQHR